VKALAGLAAVLTLTVAAGAAARSTGVSAVEGDLKAAIKAEKQALKDLDAGRLDKVKEGLEQSRSALQRTQGATSGTTRGDVRQALTKDGIALENLNNPEARDRVRLKINEAIVRKESALEYFSHHTAAPPPNRTLRVTQFKAKFPTGPKLTTTTYTVTASDPDGDKLTYTWTKRQPDKPCGVFAPAGPVATWDHPGEQQGGDCPHEEDFHEGTVTVVVSDGTASCTVVDENGSKPVPPFDPGEDCSRTGKPALTPVQAAALARSVNRAMGLEERALDLIQRVKRRQAAGMAGAAAGKLNRVEGRLAEVAGAAAIENLVHEASALDEEASADTSDGDLSAGESKLERALDRKEEAKKRLQALAKR
jgi:hypothetical protein